MAAVVRRQQPRRQKECMPECDLFTLGSFRFVFVCVMTCQARFNSRECSRRRCNLQTEYSYFQHVAQNTTCSRLSSRMFMHHATILSLLYMYISAQLPLNYLSSMHALILPLHALYAMLISTQSVFFFSCVNAHEKTRPFKF